MNRWPRVFANTKRVLSEQEHLHNRVQSRNLPRLCFYTPFGANQGGNGSGVAIAKLIEGKRRATPFRRRENWVMVVLLKAAGLPLFRLLLEEYFYQQS
jgi:hypothetical protein